ncbi:MAG: rhodanese-like domain-containing protein [Bacillota bacterium]
MEQFLRIAFPLLAGFMIGYIVWRALQSTPDVVKELEWNDFKRTMRKGQLVDIRKKEKAEKDKIKGARVFSPGRLKSKYQTKVPKDQAVYLYCDNGRKSKRVAKALARKGFKEIYVLKGGLKATKSSNK